MTYSRTRFEELKTKAVLPSPNGVALAIIALTQKDSTTITELAHAVQADPALTGKLLKYVNSASQGLQRPIVSIQEAVNRLGFSTVRQLALGFSILSNYRQGLCKGFDYNRFWSKSLATAIATHALCVRTRAIAADESFTCGLLSEVGILALTTIYPKEYGDILAQASSNAAKIVEYERAQFATDHNELTAALLEDWKLPRIFVEAVYYHEVPDEAPLHPDSREYALCHCLFLAKLLSEACLADAATSQRLMPDLLLRGARLGLDAESLMVLGDQVVEKWGEWGRLLAVPTRDTSFRSMAQPIPKPVAPKAGANPVFAMRVLIIEPDIQLSSRLVDTLQMEGHSVICTREINEALPMALEVNPQVMIIDCQALRDDSIKLCKTLRETEVGKRTYIMLLAPHEDENHIIAAFNAGVDDYLIKPINPKLLSARMNAAQRVVRLQDESMRDNEDMRRFAAELAVANRRLQQVALTDSLTNLPNRRFAMERMEQEWTASTRANRPFACMVIDIDHFKQVNDRYGHEVGDKVLSEVAHILRKNARTEDVVCRIGGEEFLVISPSTDFIAATYCAERLRKAIEANPISAPGASVAVTICIGVATREVQMLNFNHVLVAADEAVYAAKNAGRNRVYAQSSNHTAAQVPLMPDETTPEILHLKNKPVRP